MQKRFEKEELGDECEMLRDVSGRRSNIRLYCLRSRELAYAADIGSIINIRFLAKLQVPRTFGFSCGVGPKRRCASVFHLTGTVTYTSGVLFLVSSVRPRLFLPYLSLDV